MDTCITDLLCCIVKTNTTLYVNSIPLKFKTKNNFCGTIKDPKQKNSEKKKAGDITFLILNYTTKPW